MDMALRETKRRVEKKRQIKGRNGTRKEMLKRRTEVAVMYSQFSFKFRPLPKEKDHYYYTALWTKQAIEEVGRSMQIWRR